MVRGLDVFQQYFQAFQRNYIIIGGTACDIIIHEAGFNPRATKDIDIILIAEALDRQFVTQFWTFIRDGRYQQREKSNGEKEYYRFCKPENPAFPQQIELFSRTPDIIQLSDVAHVTPIPTDDGLSSLSAILLNDVYYPFVLAHSEVQNGLRLANIEALICLKIKAFLEITDRIIARGSSEDSKHARKHKSDVFRLLTMLTPESYFELPPLIQSHAKEFATVIANDLPTGDMFREMGLPGASAGSLFAQLKQSFGL
jgi:hypothetical protein